MAPASGVLDGTPAQFYLGQSVSEPGIDRTDFGIPVNCAGPEPGVYCNQGDGVESNWQLRSNFGVIIGFANFNIGGHAWGVIDLLGNFAGNMFCYNYNTPEDPIWDLTIITNLFTGEPGQFKPYDIRSATLINFQAITSTIGPQVGYITKFP